MAQIHLWPNEIRYAHSSMGTRFYDGKEVSETFEDLLYENISPSDIPLIQVMPRWGKFYAVIGNKRLRIFKRLQQEGQLEKPIPVIIRHTTPGPFMQCFTTQNDGYYIQHYPSLNGKLYSIVQVHREQNPSKSADKPSMPRLSPLPCHTVTNIVQSLQCSEERKAVQLRRGLSLNLGQVRTIERWTRGQRENPLWAMYRQFRITSTIFANVLAYKDGDDLSGLLRAISCEKSKPNEAMEYGIRNESEAIKWYEQNTQCTVYKRGLQLHRSGMLGASPDGSVNRLLVVEAKCPYKARSSGVEALIGRKDFYIKLDPQSGEPVLDLGNEYGLKYHHQIQGVMYLTGTRQCDLIIWSAKDSIIVPVAKDDTWKENIPRLKQFYVDHVIPYILREGLRSGTDTRSPLDVL